MLERKLSRRQVCKAMLVVLSLFIANQEVLYAKEKTWNPNAPLPDEWCVLVYPKKDIPKGRRIRRSDIYTVRIRASRLPSGSVVYLKKVLGKVALSDLKKDKTIMLMDIDSRYK